jgi:hypothetical protein
MFQVLWKGNCSRQLVLPARAAPRASVGNPAAADPSSLTLKPVACGIGDRRHRGTVFRGTPFSHDEWIERSMVVSGPDEPRVPAAAGGREVVLGQHLLGGVEPESLG